MLSLEFVPCIASPTDFVSNKWVLPWRLTPKRIPAVSQTNHFEIPHNRLVAQSEQPYTGEINDPSLSWDTPIHWRLENLKQPIFFNLEYRFWRVWEDDVSVLVLTPALFLSFSLSFLTILSEVIVTRFPDACQRSFGGAHRASERVSERGYRDDFHS